MLFPRREWCVSAQKTPASHSSHNTMYTYVHTYTQVTVAPHAPTAPLTPPFSVRSRDRGAAQRLLLVSWVGRGQRRESGGAARRTRGRPLIQALHVCAPTYQHNMSGNAQTHLHFLIDGITCQPDHVSACGFFYRHVRQTYVHTCVHTKKS
jgi:hypothetical protein